MAQSEAARYSLSLSMRLFGSSFLHHVIHETLNTLIDFLFA